MIYGYARAADNEDANAQVERLRQAGCKPGRIFTDRGPVGAYVERPQLRKCLLLLKPDDLFVVCALDRLGRDTHDLLEIVHDLSRRNVNFRALKEDIDTSAIHGTHFLQVFEAISRFESDLKFERMRAGIVKAKAKKIKVGAPPKLTHQQKAMALHELARGVSCETIAASFRVSRSTLYRALKTMPRLVIPRPRRRKNSSALTRQEALWQLVIAEDPNIIRVLEEREGKTQIEAVGFFLEETAWREVTSKPLHGDIPPAKRREELIEADRTLHRHMKILKEDKGCSIPPEIEKLYLKLQRR